jgi:CheY-like chemotaxis protein
MLLKGKRIFITEDNLTNRSVMQFLLEREGAVIAFERFGRESCERLQAFAPVDLILLDLMFPDNVSGYDVFDQIRQLPAFEHVPIIAVSATEPSAGIYRTREKGFSGFISKPIDRQLFIQQIAAVMNGEEVWYAE